MHRRQSRVAVQTPSSRANATASGVSRGLRFKLSPRDLVEMMAERGLSMPHMCLRDCYELG